MSRRPIHLGPFELEARIGRGGMAEVWRGIHRGQSVPVAIKVITAARAREQRYLAAFRTEVQAAASLHHPNIALLLDHGAVSQDAEEASGGKMKAGSPYLAMELASWGSLDRVKTPLRWDDLLPVLLSLLDALAHAHARGVIHRDLKPGNVLLAAPTDVRPGFKLTDFGIAHALDPDRTGEGEHASSGTPHFMSPEQFLGSWRDYGPWTDLYAVGCLAHILITGKLPFTGDNAVQLAFAHLNLPPPRISDIDSVPDEFEQWIHRLLQKDPRDRFQRAADAGWALMQIAEQRKRRVRKKLSESLEGAKLEAVLPVGGFVPTESFPRAQVRAPMEDDEATAESEPSFEVFQFDDDARVHHTDLPEHAATSMPELPLVTLPSLGAVIPTHHTPQPLRREVDFAELATVVHHTRHGATLPWMGDSALSPPASTPQPVRALGIDEVGAPLLAARRAPPLPQTWRRSKEKGPSMQLIGAGLGLYGVRSVPMVDRELERDLVWSTLKRVRQERSARAIVLSGGAGNGKSRLVEWMTQRAEEVGSAIVLKATHGHMGSPTDGLPRMVARHLRTVDLPRAQVLERVERLLVADGVSDDYEWLALTELMSPATREEREALPRVVHFGNATERHVLVRRLLERAARQRPVVVWLEDVQWGSDAIAFVDRLLEAQAQFPQPILLLLTVREEAVVERSVEARLLEALMKRPEVTPLAVRPLSEADQGELVRELLVLEDGLAVQVAARTGGNPLFAIQLVGDWVQRGVLEVGGSGFVLQPGEQAVLPDDIHMVWSQRLASALADQPAHARLALELAAVLGTGVDMSEWREACTEAGIEVPPLLIIALTESRLAYPTESGFELAHGMLRESLERAAIEDGRYAELHQVSARMLERRYGGDRPSVAERLGAHHLAAGNFESALGPLFKAARHRFDSGELREALALIARRERALESMRAPPSDARWGEGWVLRARARTLQGRFADARRWAERAEAASRQHEWAHVLPDALATRGDIAHEAGDPRLAIDCYESARAAYDRAGIRLGEARCSVGLGEVAYRLGEHARAESLYRKGLELFEREGHHRGVSKSLLGLGFIALWRGERERALVYFTRQMQILENTGSRFEMARCISALGEVARQSGDLEAAEAHYRRALAIDEAIDSNGAWTDRVNLGLVLLARHDFEEASKLVMAMREDLGDAAEPMQRCILEVELLPSLAERRAWDEWDASFAHGTALMAQTGMTDGDLAWLFALAGDRARLAGDVNRARLVLREALAQWVALGRTDRADDVRLELKALGEPV